jgi:hypothetical protein
MHTHISPRWWLLLVLGTITSGLVLLETWGTNESSLARIALLLLVYGAIIFWWRIQLIVHTLELCVARMVRRIS